MASTGQQSHARGKAKMKCCAEKTGGKSFTQNGSTEFWQEPFKEKSSGGEITAREKYFFKTTQKMMPTDTLIWPFYSFSLSYMERFLIFWKQTHAVQYWQPYGPFHTTKGTIGCFLKTSIVWVSAHSQKVGNSCSHVQNSTSGMQPKHLWFPQAIADR